MAVMNPAGTDSETDRLPRWFEAAVLIAGCVVAILGVVGLVLGLAGVYSTWSTLVISTPFIAGVVVLVLRSLRGPSHPVSRRSNLAALAALALAAGYFAFAGSLPSQSVIVDRDPGSYLNTAKWLSEEGNLRVEPSEGAFDGVDRLFFASASVYVDTDGYLEFQFNHMSSVVLAVADDVGGTALMLRTPALATAVGLLALYAVASKVLRRSVLALLPVVLIAASLPFLYVSRNTYSEPLAFLLLWTAVLVLQRMHPHPTIAGGVIGGLLLGAGVCVRIDSLLYVILAAPLVALSIATSPKGERGRWRPVAAWGAAAMSTALVALVGFVDLEWWSGLYVAHLAAQVSLMRLALLGSVVASVVGCVVVTCIPAVARSIALLARRLAGVAAVCVVAVFLVLWFVRPRVQLPIGTQLNSVVRDLQTAEGLPVDARRTYAEHSMQWMSWYLGTPALLAAIVGVAFAVRRTLRGHARPATVVVLGVLLGAGALYLWNPNITPDQLWATRRYVPAILPGLAIMCAVAVATLDSWLGRPIRGRTVAPKLRWAAVLLVSVVLVLPAAARTWPFRLAQSQSDHLVPVEEVCDLLGDRGAVIVLGGVANLTLAQTLRSWCGVPVAGQGDAIGPETIERIAQTIEGNGYTPFLLAVNASHLDAFQGASSSEPQHTSAVRDERSVAATLTSPPAGYLPWSDATPFDGPFQLHVLDLSAG